ncbi:MAG: glycosyltransferase family 39 protein [Clostridium sp.]|nr:glycosyltransferase family 39 protein [Acetatifactor muris]MCM1564062.1 glycosyltransferase family 39 protein [Clostridium sp.]
MTNTKKYTHMIIGMLIVVSFLIRFINLDIPLANELHNFRQTQTAITIRQYFEEGWSLFEYQVPVFGAPWTTCIFECPIYQTVIYAIMKVFHQGNIDLYGRIISIIIFYLSAWMLKKVMDLFVDAKVSLWICLLYVFLPFNIYWSRAILIDYMSVLFGLIYIWGLYHWFRDGKRAAYGIGLIFGILGYLLKVTTMFPVVFFLAFWIVQDLYRGIQGENNKISGASIGKYFTRNWKKLICLGLLCVIPVCVGYLWTSYADAAKASSAYTKWLTSEALTNWNYGTLEQKLQFSNWSVILKRLYGFFGGFYFLIFIAAAYLIHCKKKNILVLSGSLLSCFLTLVALFNLYYVHDYYLIALSPFLCMSLGAMTFEICRVLLPEKKSGNMLIIALAVLFIYSQITVNTEYVDGVLHGNKENTNVGLFVNRITDTDEQILIEGTDWNPCILYYADRKGFMLQDPATAPDVLKDGFYTTLVLHDPRNLAAIMEPYDVLIQYPKQDEVYVYRFCDKEDSTVFADHRFTQSQHGEDGYIIKDLQTECIKITYDSVAAGKEIPIIVTDNAGGAHSDKLYLPDDRNYMYYDVGMLCQGAAFLKFNTGENLGSIFIDY